MKENVATCLRGHESRCRTLLEREASGTIELPSLDDLIHRLYPLAVGRSIAEGNAILRELAEWWERPRPHIQNPQGECDFVALKLCRFWHLFRGGSVLEPMTVEKIRDFYLRHNFASHYQSENHALIFHATRYLMAQEFRQEIFQAYGQTGEELIPLETEWLTRYLRHRAQRGWGEFDSAVYMCPDWECLCGLYDYSQDVALKELVGQMMNLLLADMAVDSLQGMYAGAHGRIYPSQALNHASEPTRVLQYIYFGLFEPTEVTGHNFLLDATVCRFRPHPVVVDLALNRTEPYENRERKHLHNLADVLPLEPLEGSVRKYTYWTPDYAMGTVQFQDDYPANSPRPCDCLSHPLMALHGRVEAGQSCTREYAHHQQHQWDLSFAARPDARLFTHHPGPDGTHNHWTGDRRCGCGHFFQNKTALVALYDIPQDQPMAWIHAYVPKSAFDEVVERKGVIFVRSRESVAALRLLPHYRWTREGEWKEREVISDGRRHGVICEVGSLADFASFAAFQEEILGNAVCYDESALTLSYASKRAGLLEIDTRGKRHWNGKPVDLNYPTYECSHLRSAWKSGQIEVIGSSERLKLVF